jgi:5-methylcytosine-specific restriction endonuclease McrA
MKSTHELTSIPDDVLLRRLAELLRKSRCAEADLVAHIGEVDARRLYAREASPSMFAYCTEVLHLSEAEAYLRIAAARASREHPVLLEMLADGRLHLTAIAKLAPHLTPANREALLKRATHKSKREIEELVAELVPRPDAPAVMRKLPERGVVEAAPARPGGPNGATPNRGLLLDGDATADLELRPDGVARLCAFARPRPPVVEPLAPARYKVQFTASVELRDKLERLQSLMRSSVPDGDLAAIIEEAVTEKLERLEARRFARAKASRKALSPRHTSAPQSEPSPGADQDSPPVKSGSPVTRHVPAAVKRAVYERDGGRCRYVDQQGRRCTARQGLEFHHRRPFGHGGDHSVENIALACHAHNCYLAEVDYGRAKMALRRRSPTGGLEPTPSPSP